MSDRPSNERTEAEKLLDAYDACWIEDERLCFRQRPPRGGEAKAMRKRFDDARAAILAAMNKQPQEARESYLSGWVIEGAWSPFDRPEYWAGSSIWSADAYKALRFATRESAQQAAGLMCAGVNVRIACHDWAEKENHNEQ